MRNAEKIRDFVQNNKGMIHLLYETEHHLIKEFPKGKFELQQQNDITGEGYHKLYINIFVDDETFENGFMNGIHRVPSKIIPLKKELNLMMKLVLMPEVKGY